MVFIIKLRLYTSCNTLERKMPINYPKLEISLENYIGLSIFNNPDFNRFAKLEWVLGDATFAIGNENFDSIEDTLRFGSYGAVFGFNFTISPWPGEEKYLSMVENLSGQEREDRYRARILFRKFLLEKDQMNLETVLIDLYGNAEELGKNAINWLKLSANDGLPNIITWSLEQKSDLIPDDFVMKRLGSRRNITKTEMIQIGFGIGDIHQLFIYGDEIHGDEDKIFVLKLLKEQFGESIDAVFDMYSVIFYELATHVILPMVEGHLRKIRG